MARQKGGRESRDKDSVTEVAEESFVRDRPLDIEKGSVLAGRYQVEEIIGKGGSGTVLRVFDRVVQNVVALKILRPELARDTKWERRFSRELRLGRPIQHPNVCRVFDISEAEGLRFLTMELASGGSLRDELKRVPALDRPIASRLADAKATIAGLAALHAAGVVHRDFKPDNILRMADGRLILSDFGLATDVTAPGATVLIGTPHYMAPEVLAGEPATARSDVWALGVVVHEVLFGVRPERRSVSFDGSQRQALRPESALERAILALCERCLAEAPLDRPTDAGVVARLFDSVQPAQAGDWKRKPAWIVGCGLTAVALVAGGGWALKPRGRAKAATKVATKRATEPAAKVTTKAPGDEAISPLRSRVTPVDWTKAARVITEVPGTVHCFSIVNARTAQIIWGVPRRAEEVDLVTGRRSPAHLAPRTYQVDCPVRSPSGSALLFTELTPAGAKEIRLSESPDGRVATTVVSGSEAVWLGRDDEFLYLVDPSHAAVFSLATKTFTLLPEPRVPGRHLVVDQAVSKDGRTVALLLYGDGSTYALVVYDGRGFANQTTILAPGARRIQFGEHNDDLVTADLSSGLESTLFNVDWRARTVVESDIYPGFDLIGERFVPGGRIVLARRAARDAWMLEADRRVRLTSDGGVFGFARSLSGDSLLGRRDANGRVNIWWQGRDGTSKRLTDGVADYAPSFAPDGDEWAYADYAKRSIVVCHVKSDSCRTLLTDDAIPTWPVFSPDGKSLAYLTQAGSTQLVVVSAKDGQYRVSWGAAYQCPPAWSSSRTLWNTEIAAGRRTWFERDLAGRKTGRRFEVPLNDETADKGHCWSRRPSSASLGLQPAHVEVDQTSILLRLNDEWSRAAGARRLGRTRTEPTL